MSTLQSSLAERYREISKQCPPGVTLIAVTKGQPNERIIELYRLGHRDFGENYAQELLQKNSALRAQNCTEARWHFVGTLQRNKVKVIVPLVHAIHSVDSLDLAREIDTRVAQGGYEPLSCFVAINIDSESQKSGIAAEELPRFLPEVRKLKNTRWEGLMCVPAAAGDPRSAFQRLATLAKKNGLTQLSMGMSADYPAALEEGATHIRIGTALLGEREPKLES